jgi:hypothetical protein
MANMWRASVGRMALVGLAVVLGGCVPGTPTPNGTVDAGDIVIVQTPSGVTDACVEPSQAKATGTLTRTVEDTATSFAVTLTLSAPLCSPLQVKAAIYVMPAGGGAWPQTLGVVKPFVLEEAGTTTITFAKRCVAVQFDVLTGDTPKTISPDFVMHGPLLFPDTSIQYNGQSGCIAPTTTTSTTSTTTSTTSTTSTTTSTTTTSTTTSTTSTTVPQQSVWCSPGFWKNNPNAVAATGVDMSQKYLPLGGPALNSKPGFTTDPTLDEVLHTPNVYGGEAGNYVADLLSTAHPLVNFTGTRVEDSCPLSADASNN